MHQVLNMYITAIKKKMDNSSCIKIQLFMCTIIFYKLPFSEYQQMNDQDLDYNAYSNNIYILVIV